MDEWNRNLENYAGSIMTLNNFILPFKFTNDNPYF